MLNAQTGEFTSALAGGDRDRFWTAIRTCLLVLAVFVPVHALYYYARDEIKIVIASRGDYEWARDVVRQRQMEAICPVLFSPAQGLLEARSLADWILEDGLNVRFQLQLHKILWNDEPGP
jgi:organic radical activating enzyme